MILCRFVFRFGSLDIIGLHRGSALASIVRGDTLIDNVVFRINIFCVRPLIFETNTVQYYVQSTIFDNWENYVVEILNVLRSVRKPYLRASYHVYKIGCLLVRRISLLAAQLFVIAIENILREGVGNLTSKKSKSRLNEVWC